MGDVTVGSAVETGGVEMRTRIALLATTMLLVGACGSSDETTANGDPSTTTSTVVTTTTATPAATTSVSPPRTSTTAPTAEPLRVATDRLIHAWIDGWLAGDPAQVVALYSEDGVYADEGCPFVMTGKAAIRGMVTGHMGSTTYTVADPVEITYTPTGAVVQWIWAGTNEGEGFTMEASTTFEIEDALILRSTDSYNRSDTPSAWEEACIDFNGGS